MSATQAFTITFENIFRRSERKISGATLDLIGTVLRNAALDEGEWSLRDSHRIKKKGRERFRAIRVESRSGAKSVRIWCKPRGNDSCFEYSLVPPAWMESEDVFKILRRANPVTLDVPESPALPGAFLSHIINVPPSISRPEKVKVFEVSENNLQKSPKEDAVENQGYNKDDIISGIVLGIDGDEVFVALPDGSCGAAKKSEWSLYCCEPPKDELQVRVRENGLPESPLDARCPEDGQDSGWTVAKRHMLQEIFNEFKAATDRVKAWKERSGWLQRGEALERPPEAPPEAPEGLSVFSMVLDEPCLLSDQEAMDKALVALSLVADEDGYVNKNDASNSMMVEMGVRNFVKNVSGGTYTSVEGAMRALTMALSNRGNYIQKILYPSSHNVKSYKLTAKAARRVLALREKYHLDVAEWPKNTKAEPPQQEVEEKDEGMTASEANSELTVFDSSALDRLQDLIRECREAENHIKEVDAVIANLDAEISDLRIDLEALDLAERERAKQIEDLNRDIERIRAKKEPIIKAIDQKISDKDGWERDKAPAAVKKSQVEVEIFGVTGRRRVN